MVSPRDNAANEDCTNSADLGMIHRPLATNKMTQPLLADYRLVHRLRVRWAEIDLQRIVFNPHYLMYVDTAFTEYWRALAVPYESIPQLLGGDMYVKKSTLEYHGSARLDDLLDVGVRCQRVGNSSLLFSGGIFREGSLLVGAELVYVFANPATQTSRPVPQALRDLLAAYEGGEDVVEIVRGTWDTVGVYARALRHAVFAQEMGIGTSLDEDPADPGAQHVVLRNRLGQAIATARLRYDADASGSLERVAVLRSMRGIGLGKLVVQQMIDMARAVGLKRLTLQALEHTQDFHSRYGFEPSGPAYEAEGVAHVPMLLVLQ